MLIQPQKANVTPNAVFTPSISIQTRIDPTTKQLIASAVARLQAAAVDVNGNWTDAGVGGVLKINNLSALDSDIAGLTTEVAAVWDSITTLVNAVNAIRKIV